MGSASQSMLVVKANRALLKKRKSYKEIREQYDGYINHTELHFKELTALEKKKIRDKIRAQAKKERFIQLRASILALAILILIFYGAYVFFT